MKSLSVFLIFILLLNSVSAFSLVQGQYYLSEDQWIGVGSDWRVLNKPTSLSLSEVLDLWRNDIEAKMGKWNFNTVRLAFAFPDTGYTTRNVVDFQELDQVLGLFDSFGIKVVLDLHNYEDMEGFFGSNSWINAWVQVANVYKDDDRIVAFEIFNEPFGQDKPSRVSTWDSWITGGGSNISDGTEGVAFALAQCVDAIRATGDSHAIVYPDPWWFRPTLEEVYDPQTFINSGYSRENIVVAMHPWFLWDDQSVDAMYSFLFNQVEKFEAWKEYYPIWIGEFGAASPQEKPWNTQKTLCVEIVNYALSQDVGFNFWISRETVEKREETWVLVEDILESSAFLNLRLLNELDQITQDYNDLLDDYNLLLQDYSVLLKDHNESVKNYASLTQEYNELIVNFNQMLTEYDNLIQEYANSYSSYEYNLLLQDYDELFQIYNTLLQDYEDSLGDILDLSINVDELSQDFDETKLDFNELMKKYDSLVKENDELKSSNEELIGTNNSLFYVLIVVSIFCVIVSIVLFLKIVKLRKTSETKLADD